MENEASNYVASAHDSLTQVDLGRHPPGGSRQDFHAHAPPLFNTTITTMLSKIEAFYVAFGLGFFLSPLLFLCRQCEVTGS